MKHRIALSIVVLCCLTAAAAAERVAQISATAARRTGGRIFRRQSADPYRWLEEDVAQVGGGGRLGGGGKQSHPPLPRRDSPSGRRSAAASPALWNFTQYGGPHKAGGRYYYLKNDGLQNQPVLYVIDTFRRAAPHPAGPQYLVQGRHDCPGRHGRQRQRPLPGLLPGRGRLRLAPLAGPRDRHRQAARRRPPLDQVAPRLLEPGRPGLLL